LSCSLADRISIEAATYLHGRYRNQTIFLKQNPSLISLHFFNWLFWPFFRLLRCCLIWTESCRQLSIDRSSSRTCGRRKMCLANT